MKNVFILFTAILISVYARAQEKKQLPAPFKGGNGAMMQFFKDSLKITPAISKAKATGLAVFKFTADTKGNITKVIVYYADDYLLTQPVIQALKKTNGKWVIPEHYEFYDFVIPFSINLTATAKNKIVNQKAMYDYYQHRKPILSSDQVPLNTATLLPAVVVNY